MKIILVNLISLPIFVCSPIVDLLNYNNIKFVINYHCTNAYSILIFEKHLYDYQILVKSVKIGTAAPFITLKYPKVGVLLNNSCNNWMDVLDYHDFHPIFKSPFHWFISTRELSSTVNSISQYPVELDSYVTIIHETDNGLLYLYEAYNTGFFYHGKFNVNKIGFWNSSLTMQNEKRKNLNGVILKCMVVIVQEVQNETFLQYVERWKEVGDDLHKYKFYTVLQYFKDMYNFTYHFSRTNSWGYLQNGSFNGMIGALQRQEVEIGGSPVFLRKERFEKVDYTAQTWVSRPNFKFLHPKHPDGFYTIFSRPLSTKLWYCISTLLGVSAIMLGVMFKLKHLHHHGDDLDNSVSLALLSIWGAVCQQGTLLAKDSVSIKIVLFATFVFTLTVYQYYNAVVVSTLLHEPPKTIRTLQDLLDSDLKMGTHNTPYNLDYFKRTTDPVALEIYNKKIVTSKASHLYSGEDGMELVRKGGFAFLVDSTIAYRIMKKTFNEKQLCAAHEVTIFPPQNMACVVKKGSSYREHLTYGLRRFFETGLMTRIQAIWDEPRPECVKTPDTDIFSVSLREFSMALISLIFGMSLAFIILMFEIVYFRIWGKRAYIKFTH